MKTHPRPLFVCAAALLLNLAQFTQTSVFAGDHNDSPTLVNDPGADIADFFAFLDPSAGAGDQVVLIATVHPFIVPGQMTELVSFDENVRFRFEIYTDHIALDSPVLDDTKTTAVKKTYIAKVKPKFTIDVTFGKRVVGPEAQPSTGPQPIPENLRRPKLQTAKLTFTGFKDADGKPLINKGVYPAPDSPSLTVTPASVSFTSAPPAFVPQDIGVAPGKIVKFFAGVVDDPYFFDVPAFTSFTDGLRNGVGPNVSAFSRARDTFGGYNTLAIALRIPKSLLLTGTQTKIGVDVLAQRHGGERHSVKGLTAAGPFVTVDRMGHPFVTNFLIPFDRRDLYNAASAKADVALTFADEIFETFSELGLDTVTPEASVADLSSYFITKGDLLQLDTAISNTGSPAGAGYPNGRRLPDDTVDILLTKINHNMTVGDGVSNSGTGANAVTGSFPFLGKPNQPLPQGSTDPTQN